MSNTVTFRFELNGREVLQTVFLDAEAQVIRQRMADGRLLSARHRFDQLTQMHASIALDPQMVMLGAELRYAIALQDQERFNQLALEVC